LAAVHLAVRRGAVMNSGHCTRRSRARRSARHGVGRNVIQA